MTSPAHLEEPRPQPVRTAVNWLTGGISIFLAAIPVAQAFGVVTWSADQVAQITAFCGVLGTVIGGQVALNYVRNRVTPTGDPRDDDGNPLVPAMRSPHGI